MKKALIIKYLVYGIFIMIFYNLIFKTDLLFTAAEVNSFINYMKQRNDFLGTTNLVIWLVIISALVVTALNKIDKNKKN